MTKVVFTSQKEGRHNDGHYHETQKVLFLPLKKEVDTTQNIKASNLNSLFLPLKKEVDTTYFYSMND